MFIYKINKYTGQVSLDTSDLSEDYLYFSSDKPINIGLLELRTIPLIFNKLINLKALNKILSNIDVSDDG